MLRVIFQGEDEIALLFALEAGKMAAISNAPLLRRSPCDNAFLLFGSARNQEHVLAGATGYPTGACTWQRCRKRAGGEESVSAGGNIQRAPKSVNKGGRNKRKVEKQLRKVGRMQQSARKEKPMDGLSCM